MLISEKVLAASRGHATNCIVVGKAVVGWRSSHLLLAHPLWPARVRSPARWARDVKCTSNCWRRTKRRARGCNRFRAAYTGHDHVRATQVESTKRWVVLADHSVRCRLVSVLSDGKVWRYCSGPRAPIMHMATQSQGSRTACICQIWSSRWRPAAAGNKSGPEVG
jgi:hypothetical protein